MAEEAEKKEEIIIKKIIKGGGGHHGGAWKVAYADFVTAMMAFFLLLWLLATTTPEQRQGIAEYFTPTTGLKDAKGIGFQGGMTPNEKGISKSTLSQPGLVPGQMQPGPLPQEPVPVQNMAPPQEAQGTDKGMAVDSHADAQTENQSQKENTADEEQKLQQTKQEILSAFDNTPDLQKFKNNLIITNTPEGLKIDLVDDDRNAIFNPGTARMTDMGRSMLRAVGGVILRTTNHLAVTAHTESIAYPPGTAYTNWELSGDRANAARRYLSQNVVEPDRVERVAGMADRDLFVPKEPQSPRNRRISLLLLRNSHMTKVGEQTQRGLLSLPMVDTDALSTAPPPPAPVPTPPPPAAQPPVEPKSSLPSASETTPAAPVVSILTPTPAPPPTAAPAPAAAPPADTAPASIEPRSSLPPMPAAPESPAASAPHANPAVPVIQQ